MRRLWLQSPADPSEKKCCSKNMFVPSGGNGAVTDTANYRCRGAQKPPHTWHFGGNNLDCIFPSAAPKNMMSMASRKFLKCRLVGLQRKLSPLHVILSQTSRSQLHFGALSICQISVIGQYCFWCRTIVGTIERIQRSWVPSPYLLLVMLCRRRWILEQT